MEGAQTESRRGSNGGYGKGAQLGGRRKAEWRFESGVEGAQKGDRRGSNEVWTGAGLTKRVGVVEWRFGTETRKGAGLS